MRAKISTTITFEFDRPEQISVPTNLLEELAYSSQPLSLSQKEALSRLLPPVPKPVTFFEGQKVTIKSVNTVGCGYTFTKNYKRKDTENQVFIISSIWFDAGHDSPRKVQVTMYPTDNDSFTLTYKGPVNNLHALLEPVEELFEKQQATQENSPPAETDWITWNPFSEDTPPELPDEKHMFLIRRRGGSVMEYDPNREEFLLDDNEESLWRPRNFPNKDIVAYKIIKIDEDDATSAN